MLWERQLHSHLILKYFVYNSKLRYATCNNQLSRIDCAILVYETNDSRGRGNG